jgi:hypothetical protein
MENAKYRLTAVDVAVRAEKEKRRRAKKEYADTAS